MDCSCDVIIPDGNGEYYWPKWRKARKQHICYECCSMIDVGEKYQEINGIWEGEFMRFKQCVVCAEKWNEIMDTDLATCIGFGQLWDYVNEIE